RHAVALALIVALAGCGYGFAAGAGRMPAGAESVLVRPLANRTADAEAGMLVAAALRAELARRGAAGGDGAPARLEGTVLESSAALSSPDGSTWLLTLEVEARLLAGDRLLGEVRVRRWESYMGEVDALATEGRRRVALRRASEEAARELLERLEQP
ncbi:MAG TPA: LPS assembly lipoprotein LptE, partial [Anaeromyxobacteraceae bacterium]|nr:LPS assembly lipoprotein LptE [Anaeromyxobacteraceae bacterium]